MKHIIVNTNSKNTLFLPIYLHTVCEYYTQGDLIRTRGSSFYQILAVLEGEGILTCGKKTYRLKKGCAFFISPFIPVSYSGNDEFITAFLTVKGTAVNSLCEYFGCGKFFLKENIDTDKFRADIAEITTEYYGQKRESIISSLCYSFFVRFFESSTEELSLMKKISRYAEKNLSKNLTLNSIAAAHSISVSKLCHDFKKEFGCSVFEYILNLRLSYAHRFISINPGTKTSELARICGFKDTSYFCKTYKRKYNTSPGKTKDKNEGSW